MILPDLDADFYYFLNIQQQIKKMVEFLVSWQNLSMQFTDVEHFSTIHENILTKALGFINHFDDDNLTEEISLEISTCQNTVDNFLY